MARAALVTGGTRGIGAAISKALAGTGHRVAANYHGNEVAAAAVSQETGISVYKWDVADFEACRAGVERVVADLGPVEILVNNAGIAHPVTFHKLSPEQWREVIDTNLTGCFNMCRLVIGGMRERGFGRIVNIGSLAGQAGEFGLPDYTAAKAGLHGLTKAIAIENAAKGITVNTVAPGYVDTEMVGQASDAERENIIARIPVGRLGRPEEVARAALFLIDDDAGFITGSSLSMNGGQHMC